MPVIHQKLGDLFVYPDHTTRLLYSRYYFSNLANVAASVRTEYPTVTDGVAFWGSRLFPAHTALPHRIGPPVDQGQPIYRPSYVVPNTGPTWAYWWSRIFSDPSAPTPTGDSWVWLEWLMYPDGSIEIVDHIPTPIIESAANDHNDPAAAAMMENITNFPDLFLPAGPPYHSPDGRYRTNISGYTEIPAELHFDFGGNLSFFWV